MLPFLWCGWPTRGDSWTAKRNTQCLAVEFPSFNLGTIWYIYTFYAPLVLVSHLMIFWILIKSRAWKK